MGFTKALYYPNIDIENENWLKTAVLFWDELNTIVPVSINKPYNTNATQFLSTEGILKPIRVSPNYSFIKELNADTIRYLNSIEGMQLFSSKSGRYIHQEKLPSDVQRLFRIHPEKLPYPVEYYLHEFLTEDGFIAVDDKFGMFYMTLLANKLCEEKSIALLTDDKQISIFSEKVRLDNQPIGWNYLREDFMPNTLAQGLLTNLVIEGVNISENSSLTDILKFKNKYSDELSLFRTNIFKLVDSVSDEMPLEAMRQKINDIYTDEFLPAYSNLKKALNSSKIQWFTENILKLSCLSAPSSMVLFGLTVPQALLAGAGVSVVASTVLYNLRKKDKMRENPYSYLLAMNKSL